MGVPMEDQTRAQQQYYFAAKVGGGNQVVPESARLKAPKKGKSGSSLIGYEWQSHVEDVQTPDGDVKGKRVSDWNKAGTSTGTGRTIVHYFYVQHPDGTVTIEGRDSAKNILGLRAVDLMTVAKIEQAQRAAEIREATLEAISLERNAAESRPQALAAFRQRNRNVSADAVARAERELTVVTRGGRYMARPTTSSSNERTLAALRARGWQQEYLVGNR